MQPTEKSDSYPVFEANQILSSSHLNQIFDYLDEQERLTRANLVGIGIVCGLEIRLDEKAETIHLSKGCGVASEGYLMVQPEEDLELVSYRDYKLPGELNYPPFIKENLADKQKVPEQYPLWELFPAGEPETTLLGTPANFLADKAVLLFLELREEGLRNCCPNNCDDKGSAVTATLRKLLIKKDHLTIIIKQAQSLETGLSSFELADAATAKLGLPDIRLPRYDVPESNPAATRDVLAAFHNVFKSKKLAAKTAKALAAAYKAFKPLVQDMYSQNPFDDFNQKFGFLDDMPKTKQQVLFLQYYYDFFDDLLGAYDEFRWKAVDLICACCPHEELFPRHLMLGVLFPEKVSNPGIYRQQFLASPAIRGCEDDVTELKQLFHRLVKMTVNFTNTPPLPESSAEEETDGQIRITPSKFGDVLLSDKAIPYYYRQDGIPPIYRIWNVEKTRRNRANQNLSYRSDEYKNPAAPEFITSVLNYDLERYNFLRIEGHLGKDYQNVLTTLLSLKESNRLPIEIIALRTGAFSKNATVELGKEECYFPDLEALYDTMREELLSSLCEGIMYFYSISTTAESGAADTVPQIPLLKKYAPNFRYAKNTVGAWYEKYWESFKARPYIDVDQNKIDNNAVLNVYCTLFAGTTAGMTEFLSEYWAYAVSIYYLTKLAEVLPASLDLLGYADFENKYQDLMGLIRYFRSDAVTKISDQLKPFIPQEDLIDHFDQVLFSCKLEPVKSIHEEYERRIREVKQKQFLSFFLKKNPGIQHKAGVPLGGTFIIVYHMNQGRAKIGKESIVKGGFVEAKAGVPTSSESSTKEISKALDSLQSITSLRDNADFQLIYEKITGRDLAESFPAHSGSKTDSILDKTVTEIKDGIVVADFFLPYLCCSDVMPIQYVLPVPPLGLSINLGCTLASGIAEATLLPQGGKTPFTYQLDNQVFKTLQGTIQLSVGPHSVVIRDSAGAESVPQSFTVPGALTIEAETYTDDLKTKTYQISFKISGGTPPYKSDAGEVTGDTFSSKPIESEKPVKIVVTDNVGCSAEKTFTHTVPVCNLPCDGIARRCGYRFWIPEPEPEQKKLYTSYNAKVPRFMLEYPQGHFIDLAGDVEHIIQADVDALNKEFGNVVHTWLDQINKLIIEKTGYEDWLRLEYSKTPDEPIGALWIEYFECLKFEFNIQAIFARPESPETCDVRYVPAETKIRIESKDQNLEAAIPAFNCTQINKCDPLHPVIDYCKALDLQVKIISVVKDGKLIADCSSSGGDTPVAYLWEVQDGIPALSNEKKAAFTFVPQRTTVKKIWLTAYTKTGCRVTATAAIDLRAPV